MEEEPLFQNPGVVPSLGNPHHPDNPVNFSPQGPHLASPEAPLAQANPQVSPLPVQEVSQKAPVYDSGGRKGKIFKIALGLGAIIFVLLLIVFMLNVLTGGKKEQVTITYWSLWEDQSVMQPVIVSFEKENPNIKVEFSKQDPKEYRERLLTRLQNGTGTSVFAHSIESRIFNVNLAASRVTGILVKPGETFSFVKALGDVSSFTGYKQAYIIQNGRTVLGDGGGVCQVSTTLFRAVLNAGLPIEERSAHAYRVQYYEQDSPPGLDATVYYPTVDLKFRNDTGNYILVQSVIDLTTLRLTYNIYGQSDGRITTISEPVITGQSPPPEAKYEDDPTLPAGTVKQVDFAAWGANVYFTREVKRDGKSIISDKFASNYRPWQAVFLRGTRP